MFTLDQDMVSEITGNKRSNNDAEPSRYFGQGIAKTANGCIHTDTTISISENPCEFIHVDL